MPNSEVILRIFQKMLTYKLTNVKNPNQYGEENDNYPNQ